VLHLVKSVKDDEQPPLGIQMHERVKPKIRRGIAGRELLAKESHELRLMHDLSQSDEGRDAFSWIRTVSLSLPRDDSQRKARLPFSISPKDGQWPWIDRGCFDNFSNP
jgi:hypothetical protein